MNSKNFEKRILFHKDKNKPAAFDVYYPQLVRFIKEYSRYPLPSDDYPLYNWVNAQRMQKSLNKIPEHQEKMLNAIDFVWSKRDDNWMHNYIECFKVLTSGEIPSHKKNPKVYTWMKRQFSSLQKKKLEASKRSRIEELIVLAQKNVVKSDSPDIDTAISPVERKWLNKFELLKTFRSENPDRWPSSDCRDLTERKLGIWCQDLRARYRKGNLSMNWVEKLSSIKFNFDGQKDNWKERFQLLKLYVEESGSLPDIGSGHYSWWKLQYDTYESLPEFKKVLLDSIDFLSLAEITSWDRSFEELKRFVDLHGKLPTKETNPKLYSWIHIQKTRKKGLSKQRKAMLKSVGVKFTTRKLVEARWHKYYEALCEFRKQNPERWPAYRSKSEKKLATWCMAQRQVYAGTAKNRKPLLEERIERLNQIGFRW